MRIERAYRFFWHDEPIRFFWPETVETAFTNYAILAALAVASRFKHEQRHLTRPRPLAIGELAGATPHYLRA
ncbi:hypothetical protein AA309_19090 [Microvirga vignae]|uniref:Uncharacterized protein n=1 Tax=Microvirga vignae TaxID=1225564 RepID=A0A0H1R8S1_9HYPH|nr:hypothetical protein [Microvirga vignae]KLK91630.1 hypothetical protein AA309_19090 [Microvirga vignae]